MIKKTLMFSTIILSLGACQNYSDEMAFYYDDENAAPEAIAAPTQGVTSKELVIPEDLRKSQQNSQPQTSLEKSDNNSPQDLLEEEEQVSQQIQLSETSSIPLTYNESAKEEISFSEKTSVRFDDAEITPKVYTIAATRATNKMLDDTQKLYQQKGNKPKLLVLEAKKLNPQLPDGLYAGNKVIYDIIDGSQNFVMVTKLDDADYVLDVAVDAYPNQRAQTPIIEYILTLQDKNGKKIDSWKQNIRQLQNDDKSWW